jgi:hypothetical protein
VHTSDLNLLTQKALGASLLIKADGRILFEHPKKHAPVSFLNQNFDNTVQQSFAYTTARCVFEQVERIEFSIVSAERFTNRTTTGEPDYLFINLGYEDNDVAG